MPICVRHVVLAAFEGNQRKDDLRQVNYKRKHLIFDVHVWQLLADEGRALREFGMQDQERTR